MGGDREDNLLVVYILSENLIKVLILFNILLLLVIFTEKVFENKRYVDFHEKIVQPY